ncbi:MAG: hypothetical protein ACYC96_05560 [Fimbriimonadaceae bacterium]
MRGKQFSQPLYVYDNWSAYDELSDNVPLTEQLAMRQFEEVCRLRRQGVLIDAYLMDAFWYDPDGGYLTWRTDRWPQGPDAWLEACRREGILPGLWFPANTAFHLTAPDSWRNSLGVDGWGFSCSSGGFLAGFFAVLEHWYERGVRVFKFDFADFAATPAGQEGGDPALARATNVAAYQQALFDFRSRHRDAVLLAYNGFEHTEFMPHTDRGVRPVLDRKWLGFVDTVYCGDPRPSDLPHPNFCRTVDVYADAMIHLLHRGSGLALEEIDNCSFMIGACGTCYRRGAEAWRTTALLSHARRGRVHVTMGNMELLSADDASWLAGVQRFFAAAGKPAWVGGDPGQGQLYAYAAGGVVTAVNPGLDVKTLAVGRAYAIVYSDGQAEYDGESLSLGAGAVAVLGRGLVGETDFGRYPGSPVPSQPISVAWEKTARSATGAVTVPNGADMHVVFQQRDAAGRAVRTSGGSPPDGRASPSLLRISAFQAGREIAVERPDDKIIWSGMSWAYGIVPTSALSSGEPVNVTFETEEANAAEIVAAAYAAS